MDSEQAWRELAECSDTWEAINWYAEEDEPEQIEAAKALCDVCPVRNQCLEDALATERNIRFDVYGVRGGLTAEERRTLRRAMNRRSRAQKTA